MDKIQLKQKLDEYLKRNLVMRDLPCPPMQSAAMMPKHEKKKNPISNLLSSIKKADKSIEADFLDEVYSGDEEVWSDEDDICAKPYSLPERSTCLGGSMPMACPAPLEEAKEEPERKFEEELERKFEEESERKFEKETVSEINLDQYLENRFNQDGVAKKLNLYMYERDITTAMIYERCFVDRKLISKITSGKGYHPSKTTMLALCIGLQLSLEEGEDFLILAGYGFSNASKYDLIIKFMLEHEIYDLDTINEMLYQYQQPCIGA